MNERGIPFRRSRRVFLGLALAMLATRGAPAAGLPREVVVLLSDASAPYQEVAAALLSALETDSRVRVTTLAESSVEGSRDNLAIVSVGVRALDAALAQQTSVPIVALLIPKAAFDDRVRTLPAGRRALVSAVYLDQPPARQFALVDAVLDNERRLGILHSPGFELASYARAAEKRSLRLVTQSAASEAEVFPRLQALLPEIDALLLVPDTQVVNRDTIHNLLLTAYRHRVPAFGYSRGLADAGAVAAVFSTPAQVGRQGADAIRRVLAGGPLPKPAFPRTFTLRVNRNVARSLDIFVADDATLARRIESENVE